MVWSSTNLANKSTENKCRNAFCKDREVERIIKKINWLTSLKLLQFSSINK